MIIYMDICNRGQIKRYGNVVLMKCQVDNSQSWIDHIVSKVYMLFISSGKSERASLGQ